MLLAAMKSLQRVKDLQHHLFGWKPEMIAENNDDNRDDVRVSALRTFSYAAQFSWISLADLYKLSHSPLNIYPQDKAMVSSADIEARIDRFTLDKATKNRQISCD